MPGRWVQVQWAPANFDSGFSGYVLAYKALSASLNLVSVQIYDLVGPDAIINYLSRLTKAPESRFQPNPALSLGASELTPAELLLGYGRPRRGCRFALAHGVTQGSRMVAVA